jgi:hypothetical protein
VRALCICPPLHLSGKEFGISAKYEPFLSLGRGSRVHHALTGGGDSAGGRWTLTWSVSCEVCTASVSTDLTNSVINACTRSLKAQEKPQPAVHPQSAHDMSPRPSVMSPRRAPPPPPPLTVPTLQPRRVLPSPQPPSSLSTVPTLPAVELVRPASSVAVAARSGAQTSRSTPRFDFGRFQSRRLFRPPTAPLRHH